MKRDITLLALQRRLERWELQHLREHAAELAERLEQMEAKLASETDAADYWREQALQVQQALNDGNFSTHRYVGLNQAGELLVVRMDSDAAGGAPQ